MKKKNLYLLFIIQLVFPLSIFAQSIVIDNAKLKVENGIRIIVKNITIRGANADFTFDDMVLVTGDWITESNASFTQATNGFVVFEGNNTQQIKSESNSFGNIEINNTNENYDFTNSTFNNDIELQDNLTIANGSILTLTNGIIYTASAQVRVSNPLAIRGYNSIRFIDGSLSYTSVSASDGDLMYPVGDIQNRMLSAAIIPPACMKHVLYSPLTISLKNATIAKVDVSYHYETPTNWCWSPSCFEDPIHHISNLEYWKVNKSANEISDIQLNYINNTDLHQNNSHGFAESSTLFNASSITATVWDNVSGWLDLESNNSGTYTTGFYFTNSNAFPVGLGNSLEITYGTYLYGTPLPIELLSFNSLCYTDYVELYWETASEINNDKFVIEKSTDAINYIALGEIIGAGNSNAILSYSFTDNNAVGSAYYRLKQIDYDGSENISNSIYTNCGSSNNLSTVEVFPNPSHGIVNLVGEGMPGEQTIVNVTDMLGRVIFSYDLDNFANGFTKTIDLSKQAASMYFVKVNSGTFQETFKVDIK